MTVGLLGQGESTRPWGTRGSPDWQHQQSPRPALIPALPSAGFMEPGCPVGQEGPVAHLLSYVVASRWLISGECVLFFICC